MALPEFATWMNPLLAALRALGGSARPREVVERVARDQQVSDAVLDQTIAGGVSRFANQVHWARFYLAETGFIDRSRRGVWALTEKAQAVRGLTDQDIRGIIEEVSTSAAREGLQPPQRPPSKGQRDEPRGPPTIAVRDEPAAPTADGVDGDHRSQLLAVLRRLPASGFERLCQRLLREAGFEQVVVTGRSGDGGIDGHGVLALNAFVSFRVLFQCKRYEGAVGPGQVRDFRGAMQGRSDKGIMITTGSFTADARREAVRDGVPPIELVDSEKLVALFEQLELGLSPRRAYEVDANFFAEYGS